MTLNLLAVNIGFTLYILIGALYEERKLLKVHGRRLCAIPTADADADPGITI